MIIIKEITDPTGTASMLFISKDRFCHINYIDTATVLEISHRVWKTLKMRRRSKKA